MDDRVEDALFTEALGASTPTAQPPVDFAARVAARHAATRRAWRPARAAIALAAAATVVTALAGAWTRRESAGAIETGANASSATTVRLGARARAVVERGSVLRWRVGGVLPGGADRVELARGEAFFRVDPGRAFEVHTPAGTVTVTGTCFRVAVDDAVAADGGATMSNGTSRWRWFGAGAASVAMAVAVYEGGVRVASAHAGRDPIELAPGQAATVDRAGDLARAEAASGVLREAEPPAPVVAAAEPEAATVAQIERLRTLLLSHGISPETGAALPGAPSAPSAPAVVAAATVTPAERVRGLANHGDTDLTPDEWRTLAEQGRLRFRIPVGGSGVSTVGDSLAQSVGLSTDDVTECNRIMHHDRDQLTAQISAIFREATGRDPGTLSTDTMQNEVRDLTPPATVQAVNHELSLERGGLATAPAASPDASPYERMMRLLIGYEAQLLADLTGAIGPQQAHDLLWNDAMSAHSYGM